MSQPTNIQRRHRAVLDALHREGPLTSAGLARALGLESAEVLFYGRRLSHILGDMGQKQAGLIERTGDKSRLGRGKLLPEFRPTLAGLQLLNPNGVNVIIPKLPPAVLERFGLDIHRVLGPKAKVVVGGPMPGELQDEYIDRKRSEIGLGPVAARSHPPEEAERLEWIPKPQESKLPKSKIIELRAPIKVMGTPKPESQVKERGSTAEVARRLAKEDTWQSEPNRELKAVPPPAKPVPKTPAYPVVGRINDELDDQAKLRSWIAQARANSRPESASYGEVMLRMLQRQEKIEAGLLAIADAVNALLRPQAEAKAS